MSATVAEIEAIYNRLDRLFADFAEPYKGELSLEIGIDPIELGNVARSYAYDIHRYKDFHEIKIPDRARRGAYLCKWLMRLRPVVYSADVEQLSTERATMLLLVNELFAMYAISALMKIDFEQTLSTEMGNILLYSLRYRASSEDSFILFLAFLYLDGQLGKAAAKA